MGKICYNKSRKATDRRLALISFRNKSSAWLGMAVYFFFVILTTSATIETIRVNNKNNSLYVTISTALLSGGKSALRMNRGLTAYRCRLPLRVLKAPTLFYTISVYLSIKINTFDFRVLLNFLFRRYSFFMPLGCTLLGDFKTIPIGLVS